jgi:drug/metabolite transporter (DMT)-like permease
VISARPESVVARSAGQILCAAVELAVALPFGGAAPGALPAKVAGSILGLGALGTGAAYVTNLWVVRVKGATTGASVTYLVPIFATLLGVLVLGEQLTWNEPVGAAVILGGIALSRRA